MNAALPMSHFNQIKYLDDLQNAGMNEKQARAVISFVNGVSEQNHADLVTKEYLDLRLAQAEIKAARRFNALLLTVIVSILAPFFVHHFGIS